jgi:hypothetical protein
VPVHRKLARLWSFEALEIRSLLSADAGVETIVDSDFVRYQSEAQLRQALIDLAVSENQYSFGRTNLNYSGLSESVGAIVHGFHNYGRVVTSTTVASPDQAFVDKEDVVESDGRYVFLISGNERWLSIIDTQASEPRLVARVDLPHFVRGMYLAGNRLALIGVKSSIDTQTDSHSGQSAEERLLASTPGSRSIVTFLDVADPTTPRFLQRLIFDTELVGTRRIGDRLYVVSNDSFSLPPIKLLPNPGEYIPDNSPTEDWGDTRLRGPNAFGRAPRPEGVYETQQQYVERIQDMIVESVLPGYWTVGPDGILSARKKHVAATDV